MQQNVETNLSRTRTEIRLSELVRMHAECPRCGRATTIEGVPGAWSYHRGCRCFPSAVMTRLLTAAADRLRDSGLTPCPQCNHLMENACAARCRHCGFKFSCSGEP
jgi:hypothetical protein